MRPEIKAVVLRTSGLAATKAFYIHQLGLSIRESSATHFVIHSKGIRLLFVEDTGGGPEVEMYIANGPAKKLVVLTLWRESFLG